MNSHQTHMPRLRGMLMGITGLLLQGHASAGDDEGIHTLGTVTITASRPNSLAPQSTQLDAATMRQFDRHTVGTALEMEPGLVISKVGARNEQMVYLRGFDLRQVPLYVDGIPVYVPYDGYVDLGRFTTMDLARIDVAKGFSSSIYGANTLGGAINLITRKPRQAFEASYGLGQTFTNDYRANALSAYANLGTLQANWYAQLGLSHIDQPYVELPSSFTPARGEDGDLRDNSYQRDDKINLKVGYTPNAQDEYALNLISQHGEKGTPPYAGAVSGVNPRYWQWPYWNKDSIYFLSNTGIGEHQIKFRAFHDTFKNSLYAFDNSSYTTQARPSSFKSWYDDYTDGFSAESDLRLVPDNLLKVAYNWKTDVHREHNEGEPIRHFKDRTQSLGLEDSHLIGDALNLVSGVSYAMRESLQAQDYNSTTHVVSDFAPSHGHGLDGQIGAFYKLPQNQQIKLTLARKSRFPTIKDRYSYRMGTAIPNADLQTEKANHLELGYSASLSPALTVDAAVFRSQISDLIQSVSIPSSSCSSPPCSQMQNIGKARNTGLELAAKGKLGAWQYGANYTYLQRENISNPAILPTDTPRHKSFAYASWQATSAWRIQADVDAMSRRYSTSDGKQVAAGFAIFDAKSTWQFRPDMNIEFGVRNLADKLYAYTEGFPEAGRTYFLQLNGHF